MKINPDESLFLLFFIFFAPDSLHGAKTTGRAQTNYLEYCPN